MNIPDARCAPVSIRTPLKLVRGLCLSGVSELIGRSSHGVRCRTRRRCRSGCVPGFLFQRQLLPPILDAVVFVIFPSEFFFGRGVAADFIIIRPQCLDRVKVIHRHQRVWVALFKLIYGRGDILARMPIVHNVVFSAYKTDFHSTEPAAPQSSSFFRISWKAGVLLLWSVRFHVPLGFPPHCCPWEKFTCLVS